MEHVQNLNTSIKADLTCQVASVSCVIALAVIFPGLTEFDFINPSAIALAMFPPPINPTLSSSAMFA